MWKRAMARGALSVGAMLAGCAAPMDDGDVASTQGAIGGGYTFHCQESGQQASWGQSVGSERATLEIAPGLFVIATTEPHGVEGITVRASVNDAEERIWAEPSSSRTNSFFNDEQSPRVIGLNIDDEDLAALTPGVSLRTTFQCWTSAPDGDSARRDRRTSTDTPR